MVWTLAFLQHLYLYDGCVYRSLQNREPWGPELDGVTRWGTASYRGNAWEVRLSTRRQRPVGHHSDTADPSLTETTATQLIQLWQKPERHSWSSSDRSNKKLWKEQLPSKGKQSLSHPLLFIWNVWNQRVTCFRILSSKCTQMEANKSVAAAQGLSRVWPCATLGTAACQAPLSSTISWSLLNSCPLSLWCHPTTSCSAAPFAFCLQSFSASRSFPMRFFKTSHFSGLR